MRISARVFGEIMAKEIDRIVYKNKEYKLVFDLNLIEKIQEEYGSLKNFFKDMFTEEHIYKYSAYLVKEMANEWVDMENERKSRKMQYMSTTTAKNILKSINSILYLSALQEKIFDTIIDVREQVQEDEFDREFNQYNKKKDSDKIDTKYIRVLLASKCGIDWKTIGRMTFKECIEMKKDYETIFDTELCLTVGRKTYKQMYEENDTSRINNLL